MQWKHSRKAARFAPAAISHLDELISFAVELELVGTDDPCAAATQGKAWSWRRQAAKTQGKGSENTSEMLCLCLYHAAGPAAASTTSA